MNKTKYQYTKQDIEAACEFFAPKFKEQYQKGNFFLPRWIEQAIIAAWVDDKRNLRHDLKLRIAYEDLKRTGSFSKSDPESWK